MGRPLLVQSGSLLVFPTGHELQVVWVDTARQPTGVVRLVPGWDPLAVVDLPGDLVASPDYFSYPYESVAVLVGCTLPTASSPPASLHSCGLVFARGPQMGM
jgi:hypothetical protein